MESLDKWGLVLSGGGFSASYGVGVLKSLKEDHGFPSPSVVVGSSASSPTACLYSTGQIDQAEEVWTHEISNPEILTQVDGMKVPRVHVERIIEVVRQHLDLQILRENPGEIYFMATDYETGKPVPLNAKEASNADEFYSMMGASMALPGAYGETIQVRGQELFDGDLSSSEVHKVDFARSKGAHDILVVRNTRPETLMEMVGILAAAPKQVKRIYRQNKRELFMPADADEHTKIIWPSRELICGLLDSNKEEDIAATIEMGRQDALEHEEIKKLAKKLAA